jgi:hypothetical protein
LRSSELKSGIGLHWLILAQVGQVPDLPNRGVEGR